MSTTQRTGREAVATRHLINRLHRIEGQVRGIAKMVQHDAEDKGTNEEWRLL